MPFVGISFISPSTSQSTPDETSSTTGETSPHQTYTSAAKSVLDAVFMLKDTRKPKFVILTNDSVTSILHLHSGHRRASERVETVGKIKWETSDHVGKHTIHLRGRTWSSSDFLVPTKALFKPTHWSFIVGDMTFTLKSSPLALYHGQTGHCQWEIHNSSNKTLAMLSPPQRGMLKAELTIYEGGDVLLDAMLLAFILVQVEVEKTDWRKVQSSYTPESFLRTVQSGSTATLPVYSGRLASSSQRPYDQGMPSISGVSIPGIDPPAYASRANVSVP